MSRNGDHLDKRPVVSDPGRFRIGVIGSGNIIENAHIPAYQDSGFNVAAIASRTKENAKRVAENRGIERVLESPNELVEAPDIDIVDIAVPPDFQPELILKAIQSGKHVLAQKPLAVTYAEAEKVVSAAEDAGVTLAVNQNGRFDPSINALRQLISDGTVGEPLVYLLSMFIQMPWQTYYQDARYDKLMILHMSVHHIDQIRWLFGDPTAVLAITRKTPGQPYHGDTFAQYTFQFESGLVATCVDDGTNWSTEFDIKYRLQGTDAVAQGRIGWPHGDGSILGFQTKDQPWTDLEFTKQWFPDAFASTMGELLRSLEHGDLPSNSGRDNLKTMKAVFAAYDSAESGKWIDIDY